MTAKPETLPPQLLTTDQIREQIRPLIKEIMKGDLDMLQVEVVPKYRQTVDGVFSGLALTGFQTMTLTWGKHPRPTLAREEE